MKTIFQWLVLSAVVYGLAYFLPDINVNPWWVSLLVGAVLVFIDLIVKPIISILTLPITLITFGLFSIILNIFFFWIPSTIIEGFDVTTLRAIIIGALVVALVNWIFNKMRE